MKKIVLFWLITAIAFSVTAQDLSTILAKNDRAIGLNARKGIEYLQTKGYFTMNDSDAKIPFKVLQARPNSMRIETTVFGLKSIQTYNGEEAWMLNPATGLEAQKTDADDLNSFAIATALDGPFRYRTEGTGGSRLVGKEEYKGTSVYTVISDETMTSRMKYYIDVNTYLVSGVRYEYKKNGGWYSMEYRIDSYREYAGATFPGKITAFINGVEMTTIHIDDILVKDFLSPELFGKPTF
jgi:outer membrane lipoprotein-sorting protein